MLAFREDVERFRAEWLEATRGYIFRNEYLAPEDFDRLPRGAIVVSSEYNRHVDPKDLRAFAHRDWAAAARGKQQYWAERYRGDGAAPARHAATLLLEHARRLGAAGLSDSARRADLVHHLELSDRLDRAARAFTRR